MNVKTKAIRILFFIFPLFILSRYLRPITCDITFIKYTMLFIKAKIFHSLVNSFQQLSFTIFFVLPNRYLSPNRGEIILGISITYCKTRRLNVSLKSVGHLQILLSVPIKRFLNPYIFMIMHVLNILLLKFAYMQSKINVSFTCNKNAFCLMLLLCINYPIKPLTCVCLLSAYNMALSTLRKQLENPPPALPAGFNSRLWPKYHGYAPPELDGRSIEEQLVCLHLERHEQEKEARTKHQHSMASWMKAVHDKPGLRKPYCHICSSTSTRVKNYMSAIHHKHRSTMNLRVEYPTSLEKSRGNYHCFSCEKMEHGVMQGARIPIIVTSSMMADWASNSKKLGLWPGSPFHMDQLCIPGATIRELVHGLLCEYRDHPAPLDVVLFAGTNNLLQGQSMEMVKRELKEAKFEIEAANKENSVAIASIIYPPKLSKLPCDQADKWPVDFWDRTADIFELNRFIFMLNKSGPMSTYTILAPKCQTFGLRIVRGGNASGIMGRVNAHNLNAWREKYVPDMLHLREEQKLKIGKSVVNYFSYIYGLKENAFRTRQEMLEADEVEEREAERINSLVLAQGLDARRAICMRKEKRLVEELTTEQWAKAEEDQWRLWDKLEEEYLEDKSDMEEDGVQRDGEVEYLTCHEGFNECCKGCYKCDNLAVEIVMEQGRKYFKNK